MAQLPKLEELTKSVVQGPSLMTGAIPKDDWLTTLPVFKPENFFVFFKPCHLSFRVMSCIFL